MRKIEPKMIAFLDKKLALNGAAQHAIAKKDARSLFIYAAEACVGIRESGGNNNGPMVKLIQETVGGASSEAWCMAYVMTCLAYAELKTGKKSPLMATEHCMTLWNKTKAAQKVKKVPLPGAIAIWNRKGSTSGHTGIVTEWREKSMELCEGNTNSGVLGGEVVADGGGVYLTERGLKGYGIMKFIGFIKPF